MSKKIYVFYLDRYVSPEKLRRLEYLGIETSGYAVCVDPKGKKLLVAYKDLIPEEGSKLHKKRIK